MLDNQVLAVILSLGLYALYVLLPMIPAIVIYRMFPNTQVSASGVFSHIHFNTTGAFAAYVITVTMGYFPVQKTQELIAQIGNPIWTVTTKVKLLNPDGSEYANKHLVETLAITTDPKMQSINGEDATLTLPGNKFAWDRTVVRFEVPNFGFKTLTMKELADSATIDKYGLTMKLSNPILITAEQHVTNQYRPNYQKALPLNNSVGPGIDSAGDK